MPDLLLELFSEEIPARMQVRAADDLKSLVAKALAEAGCTYQDAVSHSTPRRLVLAVSGLPAGQPDTSEERKGPRVGAPDKAIEGFLGSVGLTLDDCEIRQDKKGDYYAAVIDRPGRPTADVIAEIVPDVIARFPWPKSMRWGTGALRWVRPLHSVLCVFDGEVVAFEVGGIAAGALTFGHRFHAPAPIEVRTLADYEDKLRQARVMLDAGERAETIHAQARKLASAQGL